MPPVVLRPLLRSIGGAIHRRLGAPALEIDAEIVGIEFGLHLLRHLGRGRWRGAHAFAPRRGETLLDRVARVFDRRFGERLGRTERGLLVFADLAAFERRRAEERIDEARVRARIGRDQRDLVGEQAHERGVGVHALCEQRAFDGVERGELAGIEIAREGIGFAAGEQPVIDERLGALVREIRPHDRVEERAVFPVQEQVQLVARVLRVELAALRVGQHVPARDECELAQRRVVGEREQIRVRALDAVDEVQLRGREILDDELLAGAQRLHRLALHRVARGIERDLEPQIARRERRLAEMHVRERRAGRIVDDDRQRRRAPELRERDRDRVVGGHEVREHRRCVGEEVVANVRVGLRGLHRSGRGGTAAWHRARRGRRGERNARPRGRDVARRRPARPRVEQQARLVED